MSTLGLKLVRGDETRKVNKLPQNMNELSEVARQLFGLVDLKYQYVDEEGDTVTIRSDAELQDAYTLVKEMGQRFMKMMCAEGTGDASFIAPSEEFERMELDEVVPESVPEEEQKCEQERPKSPKCKKGPWKKAMKHMKHMKGKFMNKMIGTLRQVIREELNYALKGEAPPAAPAKPWAVHRGVMCDRCEMKPIVGNRYKCMTLPDFDLCQVCYDQGHEYEMALIPEPQQAVMELDINVGDLQKFGFKNFAKKFNKLKKPKFQVEEFTRVKKTVTAGEENQKTITIKNTGRIPIPAGSQIIQVRGPSDTSITMSSLDEVPVGETASFSVTFNSSSETGKTRHVWKLITPEGVKFGPRMGCHYEVIDLSSVPENHRANVEALVSMGFTLEEAQAKIQEANGDIGLAVSLMTRA